MLRLLRGLFTQLGVQALDTWSVITHGLWTLLEVFTHSLDHRIRWLIRRSCDWSRPFPQCSRTTPAPRANDFTILAASIWWRLRLSRDEKQRLHQAKVFPGLYFFNLVLICFSTKLALFILNWFFKGCLRILSFWRFLKCLAKNGQKNTGSKIQDSRIYEFTISRFDKWNRHNIG